ncbi:hypothetical protein RNJ44_03307 [Nakaseomyces bracarensis]|uniref:CAP-Gly domain-containing protein n=1 Tax=Nakaseomyces bracarensis TaxID=273131 RepID=A0ABR4NZJ8_9SACH
MVSVGDAVHVNGNEARVKFIGETSFASGIWYGVEFEEPIGKNNGSVEGIAYFELEEGHSGNYGLFCREAQIVSYNKSSNEEVRRLKRIIFALEDKLQMLRKQKTEPVLSSEYVDQKDLIDQLQSTIENMTAHEQTLLDENMSLRKQLQKVTVDTPWLAKNGEQTEEIISVNNELVNKITKLQAKNEKLNVTIENLKDMIDNLKDSENIITKLTNINSELQMELERLKEENELKQSKYEEYLSVHALSEEIEKELQKQLGDTRNDLVNERSTNKSYLVQISNLKHELNLSNEKLINLEKEQRSDLMRMTYNILVEEASRNQYTQVLFAKVHLQTYSNLLKMDGALYNTQNKFLPFYFLFLIKVLSILLDNQNVDSVSLVTRFLNIEDWNKKIQEKDYSFIEQLFKNIVPLNMEVTIKDMHDIISIFKINVFSLNNLEVNATYRSTLDFLSNLVSQYPDSKIKCDHFSNIILLIVAILDDINLGRIVDYNDKLNVLSDSILKKTEHGETVKEENSSILEVVDQCNEQKNILMKITQLEEELEKQREMNNKYEIKNKLLAQRHEDIYQLESNIRLTKEQSKNYENELKQLSHKIEELEIERSELADIAKKEKLNKYQILPENSRKKVNLDIKEMNIASFISTLLDNNRRYTPIRKRENLSWLENKPFQYEKKSNWSSHQCSYNNVNSMISQLII